MNNQEKALSLLTLLGDDAQTVLECLPSEISDQLAAKMPFKPEGGGLSGLVSDVLERVNRSTTNDPDLSPGDVEVTKDEGQIVEGAQETVLEDDQGQSDKAVDVQDIVARLSTQKPQLVAFILAKLDESMRADILAQLPIPFKESVEQQSVEFVPISEKVFDRVYQSIFTPS